MSPSVSSLYKPMSETPDKTVIQKKSRPAVADATCVASAGVAFPGEQATVVARKVAPKPPQRTAVVGVGTILKQRFELTALLGSGGMGSVYKARDLRQVEAGDRHPWVAVKIINDSFARHEHALVTLQQETKKTQRLAHPNIVSVYDFDREGDVAFMTMELLEGQSLDAVLARKSGGLALAEAKTLIRQICQAVDYAHKQGIVHADLKPANIFLTDDGRVKILDFGIAQAMQCDGNFDTQVLNALTPAYASVRMLAGQRPQAIDDLYALGCIFYLVLTGRHPFNRKRATEADAAQLEPARLSFLKSRQWRALSRLLAFQPDSSVSIDQFQRQFFENQDARIRTLYQRAGLAVAALLVLVVGVNVYLNQSVRTLARQLAATELPQVLHAIEDIRQLSGSDKVVVLERARDDIADHISQQIVNLQTAADYRQLDQYLAAVGGLYPDSSRIQLSISDFATQRDAFVATLADQIATRIEQREFARGPVAFAQQVQDLQTIAPQHELFEKFNLKSLLAQEAGVATYLGQRETALEILTQADLLFPQDKAGFQQIRDRLDRVDTLPVGQAPNQPALQDNGSFAQIETLLNQYQLDQHPEQLAAFLQALSAVDAGLYSALRQGIRDWVGEHQRSANGKAFSNLQQQLFGTLPVLAVAQKQKVVRDPCSIRLANLGKQRGARCRDSLARNEQGPELVVINANGLRPFAMTRSEISIDDFNLYCQLYRRCVPAAASVLPMTNIDLQQARFYAQWLSRMTGYEYRLPTLEEWLAVAQRDSGVSDHNCILTVSGRTVRGLSLRAVDQGYANTLGVLNILGNAEEWVTDGNNVLLVGGGADTPMSQCNVNYRNNETPAAATPFRGLRLVRELKSN